MTPPKPAAETATANIKVKPTVRDRINADARSSGITPGVFLEQLVEKWEREQFLAEVSAGYAALSPADLDEYADEASQWQAVAARLPE